MYVIRKATCCDLLTWGPLQVWHRKVGQWEEEDETCRVTDCIYLLKLAPQWSFLLYLKFLWCTIYPLHFYFNICYISTSIFAPFLLQYSLHFYFNIHNILSIYTSTSATFLFQYPLHFCFNIRYLSASISATFLLQYPLLSCFSIRYISASISATFLLQYPLPFCFNIHYFSA